MIVVVLPDTGERYSSTWLFDDDEGNPGDRQEFDHPCLTGKPRGSGAWNGGSVKATN